MLSLNPSTKPQANATVFLYAPHNSAPIGSTAGVSTSVPVDNLSETRSATDLSWQATKALVSTPLATSGAIVGPVITTTGLFFPALDNFFSKTSEINLESSVSGANPLAKSTIT